MQAIKKTTATAVNPDSANETAVGDTYAPRKMTLAENAILTVKILAALGSIGVVIWLVGLWKAVE